MHQIKPGLRRQDLEGINLPSSRSPWNFVDSIFMFLIVAGRGEIAR
jgi:hypothetical protein